MPVKDHDNFYLQQSEPVKSCLLALKEIILSQDKTLSTAWKYSMPFFCYKGKMFCYLWTDKKTGQPYLGMVDGQKIKHPDLIADKRSRMAVLHFDPNKDLPIRKIKSILKQALELRAE